jgi:hypothetical protein
LPASNGSSVITAAGISRHAPAGGGRKAGIVAAAIGGPGAGGAAIAGVGGGDGGGTQPASAQAKAHIGSARRHPHFVAMTSDPAEPPAATPAPAVPDKPAPPKEIGGPAGPEPTRYGDWEQKGRCTDF